MDIGGTSIKFGIYSEEGNLVERINPLLTANGIINAVLSIIHQEKESIEGVATSSTYTAGEIGYIEFGEGIFKT